VIEAEMRVVTKPTCRVPACYETIESAQMLCDKHWARVSSKARMQLFEALSQALDEAVCVDR
jgi:hypothetical protein